MKKQLLNESEIRRMMKFANIGTLTNDHLARLDEVAETTPLEEEELEEGMREEGAPADDVADVADMGAELDDEDMGDEPEADGEMELSQEEADVLIALGQRLEGAGGEEGLDMDAEMEADVGADLDMEMASDEEELEEELVNEVLSRVARRLKTLK